MAGQVQEQGFSVDIVGLWLTLSCHSEKVLVQIQARSSCVVPGLFLDIPAFSPSPETCMGLTGDSKLVVGVSRCANGHLSL